MTYQFLGLLLICTPLTTFAQEDIHITLHSNSTYEQQGKEQLERILASYSLAKWIFTRDVLIQSRVIPHSHPVLTLNTRYIDDDNVQLATFLHEQIHWYADEDSVTTEKVIAAFRKMYPEVPVGKGEGARSEYSSYLHLLVCWLEFDALRQLLGEQTARDVLAQKTYYKWIYKQVLESGAQLEEVIRRYDMAIN